MGRAGQPFERAILDQEFTAEVSIRMKRTSKNANGNGYFDDPELKEESQLLKINLKSDTLQNLKAKIHAHTDLAEEQ